MPDLTPEDLKPVYEVALTSKQEEICRFIVNYLLEHCYQPSTREICQELGGVTGNTMSGQLKALEKKGYLRLPKGSARSWELSDKALALWTTDNGRLMPVLGMISPRHGKKSEAVPAAVAPASGSKATRRKAKRVPDED